VNEQVWWYLTRSSGIVAWLMLTASVIWGVVLATKAFPEQRRPAWLLDLHRWLGGLAVSFTMIHVGALVADSYVHFGFADVTVPFASQWRPGAIALGVAAMWLLVAVEATSLAMKRLPRKVWRWVHLSSYAVFLLVSFHAALAGTDRTHVLYQGTAVASIVAVVWATVYRLTHRRAQRPARPRTSDDRLGERQGRASSSATSFGGAVRRYDASSSSATSVQSVDSSRSMPIQPEGPR
jgi:DMSO/TMAO reductase YedYZ heme-binding membrane subunit